MIIGFFSPDNLDVAPALLGIASFGVLKKEKKVLIINATNKQYDLEQSLGISNESLLQEIGIDYLFRSLKVNKLTREMIQNASLSFYNNKLNILTASSRMIEIFREDVQKELLTIVRTASEYYDIVLIHLDCKTTLNVWDSIIDCCNKVVLNLSQNKRSMDRWVSLTEQKKDKFIYYIDKYDTNSFYNLKNLARKLPHKIVGIPYETSYYDSIYQGKVIEYMERENLNRRKMWDSFLDKIEPTYKVLLQGEEDK